MKKVSLVLGSGGARGLVHLGIIDWLIENDYEICSISGCSIGAVVGGIYAAGKYSEFKDFMMNLNKSDVLRLTDIQWSSSGLLGGERLINRMREFVGDHRIENLPVKFTAVATDLENGKEKWFQDGDLFDAIRASIAVPNLLTPKVVDDRIYVDGGLLNPVPISPTLRDQTDLTIAVDLAGIPHKLPLKRPAKAKSKTEPNLLTNLLDDWFGESKEEIELPNAFDVTNRSFDIMQSVIGQVQMSLQNPDYVLQFSRKLAKTHEFWKGEELYRLGYEEAEKVIKNHGVETVS